MAVAEAEAEAEAEAVAVAVAERDPWVEGWTPINEPLTAARFSALYGLWYPRRRRDTAPDREASTSRFRISRRFLPLTA